MQRFVQVFGISADSLLLKPAPEGRFELFESALRFIASGRREDVEAWIHIGRCILDLSESAPAAPPPTAPGPARRRR